jgi:hypothetical protein
MLVVGVVLVGAGIVRSGDPIAPDAPAPSIVVGSASTTSRNATTSSTAAERHTAAAVADSILTVDGRRYRVGQAGDEVLVEDWDCDGTPTPALLRPGTGEVFVFSRWIERKELAVEPLLTVAGAEALVSETAGAGCPSLSVRTAAGESVPVIEAVVR